MNRKVLLTTFFGTVLSMIHFLSCEFVDGYNFEVNKIEKCPRNKTEWSGRSTFLKCNESKGYTCIPNENLTELLEFCYRQPKITVPKGVCLFLRSADVDGYNCHNFTDGCPNSTYFSNEVYMYPNCVSISNGCFLVDSNCNSSEKFTQPATRKVLEELHSANEDARTSSKNVFWIFFGLVIISLGLYLYFVRKRRKQFKYKERVIDMKCQKNHIKDKTEEDELLRNILSTEDISTKGEICSPLFTACLNGEEDNVQRVIDMKCQKNHIKDKTEVDELLRNILSTEDISTKGEICSPLFTACLNGEVDNVQQCLNNNDGTCIMNQILPLYVACYKGHTKIVEIMLENYGKKFNEDGHSPIHSKLTVQQLLNMNGRLFENLIFSPLHIACQNGNTDVVDILLKKGANVNLCNADGISPLYLACQEGHTGTVLHLLLENNLDVDRRNDAGKTALHVACLRNHVEVVKSLLIKEANINVCDNKEKTPLDVAIDHGWTNLVQLLIDKGATS